MEPGRALMWLVRHIAAIVILPVMAAIALPAWLCRDCAFTMPPLPFSAAALVASLIGIALFASTVYLFANEGHGTLAPWDPPARLVVRGPYRFVRNPMISGVFFIIVAEALLLRSIPIAGWAAAFLLINAIYIPLVEEPGLERRFGDEYRAYRSAVPRLLPTIRGLRRLGTRPGPPRDHAAGDH